MFRDFYNCNHVKRLNERCRFLRGKLGILDVNSECLQLLLYTCVFSLWIVHSLPTIVSHCSNTMFKVLTQCICFAFIRHGYARWQYISDDRENGLFEAARQELNLPSANEIIGAQSNNEANVSMCSLCLFLQISKWHDPLHFLFPPFLFQGNLEGAQEGQVNSTSMSHYKEIQRKIVEFLRKRYHLLERALNLEYAVVQY